MSTTNAGWSLNNYLANLFGGNPQAQAAVRKRLDDSPILKAAEGSLLRSLSETPDVSRSRLLQDGLTSAQLTDVYNTIGTKNLAAQAGILNDVNTNRTGLKIQLGNAATANQKDLDITRFGNLKDVLSLQQGHETSGRQMDQDTARMYLDWSAAQADKDRAMAGQQNWMSLLGGLASVGLSMIG